MQTVLNIEDLTDAIFQISHKVLNYKQSGESPYHYGSHDANSAIFKQVVMLIIDFPDDTIYL